MPGILASDAAGVALQYSTSEGYPPLRDWIAGYMASQGVACAADNVLITSGSQQALEFLGKLFLDANDTALVEAPTYLGALQAFSAYEPRYDVAQAGHRQRYAGGIAGAGGGAWRSGQVSLSRAGLCQPDRGNAEPAGAQQRARSCG